jgi:hypothetical protein
MSLWDSNIDDELLALAGEGVNSQKSRKKRQAPSNSKSSTKRRKAEYVSMTHSSVGQQFKNVLYGVG